MAKPQKLTSVLDDYQATIDRINASERAHKKQVAADRKRAKDREQKKAFALEILRETQRISDDLARQYPRETDDSHARCVLACLIGYLEHCASFPEQTGRLVDIFRTRGVRGGSDPEVGS